MSTRLHIYKKCVSQLRSSRIEMVTLILSSEKEKSSFNAFEITKYNMAAPISTFLKKNNWNPWLSKELNNCNKIFAEFHDSCQYISVFLWINSVGSSMVEHSLPSKINLNADFVYQIEFMHKAMCTYIFWHFRVIFFCFRDSQAITAFSSPQLCHTFLKTLVFVYCVENTLGYSVCSTGIIQGIRWYWGFFLFLFLHWDADLVFDMEVIRDLKTSQVSSMKSF